MTNRFNDRLRRLKCPNVLNLLPLVILVIGSSLAISVGQMDSKHRRDEQRAQVELRLNAIGAQVESSLRSAFGEAEGIAQLISLDGRIDDGHFRAMADQVLKSVGYIHHLVIAPGDVMTAVYPLHGNEQILGRDYRTLGEQYAQVQRARRLAQATLDGPLALLQGGRALIYRRPIFLTQHRGMPRYWGSLAVVADIDPLLKATGLADDQTLDVALRTGDNQSAPGVVISGDATLFQGAASVQAIKVPGGAWQLAGQPHGGWTTFGLLDSSLFILCQGAVLLFGVLTHLLGRSHRTVSRRNQELSDEIFERVAIQASLVQSEDRFRTLFERSPDPVWIVDAQDHCVQANAAALKAFGFSDMADFRGLTPADVSPVLQPDGQTSAYKAMANMRATHAKGVHRFEWLHKHTDGSTFAAQVTLCIMQLAQETLTYSIVRDITQLKRAQAELEQLAHYDAITRLPNRPHFHLRLNQAIEQGAPLAVLILDVDGFKTVNDTLGHPLGDRLLQQATQRFIASIAASDTVARLGGDEFAFILLGNERVMAVVQALVQALHAPFDLDGNTALVTASIGVALFPEHGKSSDELLRHADTAMYAAKESGRNDYRVYQASMTRQMQARVDLEHALRRALAGQEFEVWYQPKVDLFSGRVEGAEALLRWHDPQLGLVMPGDFIPLAERTGLIVPMGEWLLAQVCQQLQTWQAHGHRLGHIAVNVAVPQIERSDFVATVQQALARHGLNPCQLEVEVTESLIMESPDLARNVLRRLQALGVHTAVDDFGTGYSSLAYLHLLPIDHLKIDRAFIRDLPDSAAHAAITRAIIDLGRALEFRVTAEGIETQEQYEFLRNAGCDSGQGYLIGRPMPAKAFEAWLVQRDEVVYP
ncbi:MAG: EAL domain-containing protein [Pseudomonas sp.]|nr:EAL domain-containing protein [Pseudomonas sp.]